MPQSLMHSCLYMGLRFENLVSMLQAILWIGLNIDILLEGHVFAYDHGLCEKRDD